MNRRRLAVIGVGHLGRIHAKKLAAIPSVELVGVVDTDRERAERIGNELSTDAFHDHLELTGQIDAAVVATPARSHYRIAKDLLERRIHTFVEKPLTTRLPEADHLVNLAEDRGAILQAGHIERFNPAWTNVVDRVQNAKYIDARRAGQFSFRAVDIGVVLDLMVHDIDLILQLNRSEVINVEAFGVAVLGRHEDMAQARLRFANGCIADIVASRLSPTSTRTMNIFAPTMFARVDFANHSTEVISPQSDISQRRVNLAMLNRHQRDAIENRLFETALHRSEVLVGQSDAMNDELYAFLNCVHKGNQPAVTGADGRDAIAVAETIIEKIELHRWNASISGPSGPMAMPEMVQQEFMPRIWTGPDEETVTRKAG